MEDTFENYKKDKWWWFNTYIVFAEVKSQDPTRYDSFCEEFIILFYKYGPPSLRRKNGRLFDTYD